MTNFSKLTDDEINERIERLRHPDVKIWYKGIHDNYIADNDFCFHMIKELKMDVCLTEGDIWVGVTDINNGIFSTSENKNLNRAICECYLKIKQMQDKLNG